MTSVSEPQTQPTPPPPSATRSVARATAGIGALHFIRFLIGFAAQPLIAHNFGLSWPADVYAVSTDIVQRFWLVFEKVINPAFLPQFIASLKEDGEEEAWKLASTALWLFLSLLVLATGTGMLIMPWLVLQLSPKSNPQQIALTISSARMLLLGLTALGVSSLTYTILNGYKRFVWAALGDALWKAGVFFGAFAAFVLYHKPIQALMDAQKKTPLPANDSQLLELSLKSLQLILLGFFIGSLLKLVPHVLAIGPKWRLLRPRVDFSNPRARKMLLLAAPLVLGIVVSESRGFFLTWLTGLVTSSDAPRFALKLSRLINDTFIQVFPYALSIGIFPFLADLARERDRQPMTDLVVRALRVCFFVFVPLTGIMVALSSPLVYAMWSGGRLTTNEALTIVPPFIAYSLGLTGFACEAMLGQTFYAMTRTWAPTLIGLGISLIWILIAWVGVTQFHWGLKAVAGAEAFSKSLKCLIMWYLLKPHLGNIKRRDNLMFFLQLLAATVVAALVAHFAAHFLAPSGAGKGRLIIGVTASGFLAVASFVVIAKAINIEELRMIGRRRRPA
ncbi:lipid II flippase MurJ [Abditibacteriota bacterium]|nr:lipid II flippase MurJ [Abditibacteriota bacterium]